MAVVVAVKAVAVAPQVEAAAVVAEESGVDAVGVAVVVVAAVGAAFTKVDIPVEELRGISRGPASILP
jgi:hypothetical protein